MENNIPLFVSGTVVKGFGRGSYELGIRTGNFNYLIKILANYDFDTVKSLKNKLKPGVYNGLCTVESYDGIFECVLNVGWCPFYNNEHMSVVFK